MFRLANVDDLVTLKELWYESFLEHDSKESIDFYFETNFDLEHTFILEVDEKIVTSLQLNQHILMIDGQPEPVSFVVGVATFKEHQRKGYMKLLLNYALEYAKDILSQRLIILQAYDWDIYRPFGFVETYYKNKTIITKEDLEKYDEVKLINYDSTNLLKIYQNYTSFLNGYKIRDMIYYQLQRETMKVDNVETVSTEEAYAFYQVQDKTINITEVAYISNEALCSLLKTLVKKTQADKIIIMLDNLNFTIESKELFMMSKKIGDIQLDVDDRLYISEWT